MECVSASALAERNKSVTPRAHARARTCRQTGQGMMTGANGTKRVHDSCKMRRYRLVQWPFTRRPLIGAQQL
ncbi:hypothetical protein EBBID32_1990 [Sphingobium indicum BiD32]|uniref:Uncharacterized protein n=1 Tax=Sphingobium indicum BiD32 TaxID=1301087 RepID=N1MFX9_9SPHN|nr:hypothetical protein EBBID32_1990 [Sphingobium indicum BiD32]